MKETPLQVYLDERDRGLLQQLARREGLSLAEALRVGSTLGLGSRGARGPTHDLSTRPDEYAVKGWRDVREQP
jgi:hypothetical protein